MLKSIVKSLLLLALAGCVLFNAASHTAKYLLLDEPRFHHLSALDTLQGQISPDDVLFFSDDRYALLFLERLNATYEGTDPSGAYWILPYFIGSRELEERTVKAFVCMVLRKADKSIVWALDSEINSASNFDEGMVTIFRGNRIPLRIDFAVEQVLYRVRGTIFLRGRVTSITEEHDHNGRIEKKLLYQDNQGFIQCRSSLVS